MPPALRALACATDAGGLMAKLGAAVVGGASAPTLVMGKASGLKSLPQQQSPMRPSLRGCSCPCRSELARMLLTLHAEHPSKLGPTNNRHRGQGPFLRVSAAIMGR